MKKVVGSGSAPKCHGSPALSSTLQRSDVNVVQACATWLVHHPYLLGDKECLATVVEVAELGVSGTDIS
jgi:hypothetical protein